ncbi:lytic transglycosylase domain-containing protein [Sphingobacterium sp. Mn56C]|uniref:lytic transglycosylase domain-containing protein n=1 Tax=Sphingobacterium sp. Mn56C TaxID=3395261 RepID=UPI003BDCF497
MLAHAERLQKTKATALYETENEGANELTFASENIPTNRAVVKQKLNTYMARLSYQRQQTHELHHKASKFLPQIAAILKSHGVPEDFKYIPLVESGLDPKITSHKGAGGYWQFMPATARLYGLKVNGSIDERKNFVKSTHAAARYLKSLYQEFGDWTLVAAAYNVGGGSLKASIRRQKQDDYFKLRLNAETGSYVYKLVSMKAVIENPTEHGYRI